jgi:predicted small lipoprotein YifL
MIPLQSQRFAPADQQLESDSDSEEEQTLNQLEAISRKRKRSSNGGCLKGVLIGVVLSVAVGALLGIIAFPPDNKNTVPQSQPV